MVRTVAFGRHLGGGAIGMFGQSHSMAATEGVSASHKPFEASRAGGGPTPLRAVAPAFALLFALAATAFATAPMWSATPHAFAEGSVTRIVAATDLRPRLPIEGEKIATLRMPQAVTGSVARQYTAAFDRAAVPQGALGVMLPVSGDETRLFINALMLEPERPALGGKALTAEIPRFGLVAGRNRIEVVVPPAAPYEWPRGLYFGPLEALRAAAARQALIEHVSLQMMAVFGAGAAALGFFAAFFSHARRYFALPSLAALLFSLIAALDWHAPNLGGPTVAALIADVLVAGAGLALLLLTAGEMERWTRPVTFAFRAAVVAVGGVLAALVVAFWSEPAALYIGQWSATGAALIGAGTALVQALGGEAALKVWPAAARTVAALAALALLALAVSAVGWLGTIPYVFGRSLYGVAGSLASSSWLLMLLAFCVFALERGLQTRLGLSRIIREQEARLAEQQAALEREIAERAILEERERFSKDIHDGVGGSLVSLLMRARTGGLKDEDLAQGLERALEDLRLMIDALDHARASLPAAFSTFQTRIAPAFAAAGIALHWNQDDLGAFALKDPRSLLHVFRILQEACTNVIRHSGAKNAAVRIAWSRESGALDVAVEDDGRGGGPAMRGGGKGLANMKSRAEEIGGRLSAGPRADGAGWRVVLSLPGASAGAIIR